MQYEEGVAKKEQQNQSLFEKVKGLFGYSSQYDFDSPEPYAPPRFEANDAQLSEYFDANGYVVIKNAASPEQIQKAISLFWDLAEQQQPKLKRDDPSTWIDENWIASTQVGIMSGYGVGQSEFLWYIRQLPKVKEAFTKVWGTDDLIVSYDGCGVFRPIEYDPNWKTFGGWYHIDQNVYNKKGRHAVQGLVNLFPSGPHDGGFVVVPKSTHMIDAAAEKDLVSCGKGKNARDYVRVHPDEPFWVEAAANVKRNSKTKYDLYPVKLVIEPGDLVLWDSRAIHCNHPVTKASKDADAKNRLKRLVAYVCMTPTSMATDIEKLVKYRVLGFQNGITTTHWPHEFQPTFVPKDDKLPGVGASVVKLTAEQARLITGNNHIIDVYDERFVQGVNVNDLF